jgi:hypothetical protein
VRQVIGGNGVGVVIDGLIPRPGGTGPVPDTASSLVGARFWVAIGHYAMVNTLAPKSTVNFSPSLQEMEEP